ncbi:MAG TPA: type II toxin-antitoxin system ParD family antitoxin [Thermoanaerobaculia bacterium]|jgi:antitoxin ParD1/3/4|nr:type II toxin-antitoxin system ParD family antitoxin [Thermoanaerobaculia bacterium]
MTTLNISLPDNLKDFAEEQATLRGYPSLSDYIRFLLSEAQDRRDRVQLEGKLLAALDAEADEMRPADWDRLRERVRQTASKR